jgi:aspartyl-tRNA(Asn)/glutamyl-tRNA(Gln) amidotransferase subunit C
LHLYDVSRVVTLPETVPGWHFAGCYEIPEGPTVKRDLETVERIAALARIGLTPDEMERMRDQLSAVLDHISMLQEVNTDDIPPTAQVIELQNIMRDDVVEPSLTQEQVLLNAPRTEDGFIKVKAVLDGS